MPRTAISDVAATAVGRAIRTARHELGLTQAELASRLEVNPSYVTNLEAGRVNATIGQLAHIAEALGAGLEVRFPVLAGEPVRMPHLPRAGTVVGARPAP